MFPDTCIFVEENLLAHFLLFPSVHRFVVIFTVQCLRRDLNLESTNNKVMKYNPYFLFNCYLEFFPVVGSLRLSFEGNYDHNNCGNKKKLHVLVLNE